MWASKVWLTVGLWASLAALLGNALVETTYYAVVFTLGVSTALTISLARYRQQGGPWRHVIIGAVAVVVGLAGGMFWLAARP